VGGGGSGGRCSVLPISVLGNVGSGRDSIRSMRCGEHGQKERKKKRKKEMERWQGVDQLS